MVGQEIVKVCSHRKREKGKTIFRYGNIQGMGDNLDIYEGEILGITGLAGQGQEQLLEGLFGLGRQTTRHISGGVRLQREITGT